MLTGRLAGPKARCQTFGADGKDTMCILTIKVFLQRTFRFAIAKKELVSKRVAKIGRCALPPNIFCS
jgi:hypothetical protein